MKKNIIVAVTLLAAMFVRAEETEFTGATWYVDDDNYGKAGMDGTTEETAYGTIQEAVNAASAKDIVVVLPGVYTNGTANGSHKNTSWYQPTRVVIDKKLYVKSRDGRETTHVVGSYDLTEDNVNQQKKSVSGFYVTSAAKGSIIEGFTIRDCGSWANNGGAGPGGSAVATETDGVNADCYVAYCTMSNNCAYRGGAMKGGMAIGCFFSSNWCWNNNAGQNSGAAHFIHAYNCVFVENSVNRINPEKWNAYSAYALNDPGLVINCTLVNNYGRSGMHTETAPTATSGKYYNVVCYDNYADNNNHDSIAEAHNVYYAGANFTFADGSTDTHIFSYGIADKTNLVVCPMLGDYRPVKGGLLDGNGIVDYIKIDLIPERFRYRDFAGNAFDPLTKAIPIGALLEPAEVKTAPVRVTGNYARVNGHDMATYNVDLQAAEYPFNVTFEKPTNRTLDFLGINLYNHRRWMGRDGKVQMWLKPLKDEQGADVPLLTIGVDVAKQTKYVDIENKDDTEQDGSETHPYASIQAAINDAAVNGKKTFTLIKVAPGVYNNGDGETDLCDSAFKSRIAVPASTYVFLWAVDQDPANTVIEGAPDPDTINDATQHGCGPNAMRCVSAAVSATMVISGFTFRKGYSNNITNDSSGSRTGGVRGGGDNQIVQDCVFTQCYGNTACINQTWAIRCLFTGNYAYNGGVILNATASGCIFKNNIAAGGGYMPLATGAHAYQCTIYETDATVTDSRNCYNAQRKVVNSVIAQAGYMPEEHTKQAKVTENGRVIGNVINVLANQIKTAGNYIGSAKLEDPANGKYAPSVRSAALGLGVLVDPDGTNVGVIPLATMHERLISGYDNGSIVQADGRIRSGAITKSVREVLDVYVKPDGDDAADGYSEATAKKTIPMAIACFNSEIDGKLVVMPGTYNYGDAGVHAAPKVDGNSSTTTLKNRVIVPAGFTLESRDGAETTIIEGSRDKNDPIRCVFLETGATIKGFTFFNGGTLPASGNIDDEYGAGVLGRGKTSATVEDCIFTECSAVKGGGVAYATVNRCKFDKVTCSSEGSATFFSSAYNSYFVNCWGSRVFDYFYDVVNCTVGENCANSDKGSATHVFWPYYSGTPKLWNTIVYSEPSMHDMGMDKVDIRNVVLPKGTKLSGTYTAVNLNMDYTMNELQAMFVDGKAKDYTTLTLDAGYADAGAGDTDLGGTSRVKNRSIDIGAYEYDWKGDLASIIAKAGKATVTDISDTAQVSANGVNLQNGDVVTLIWNATKTSGRIYYTLGTGGSFTITIGTNAQTITSGSYYDFGSVVGPQQISISCDGGDVTLSNVRDIAGMYMLFM